MLVKQPAPSRLRALHDNGYALLLTALRARGHHLELRQLGSMFSAWTATLNQARKGTARQDCWSPHSDHALSPQDYVIEPGQFRVKGLDIDILKMHGDMTHTGNLGVSTAVVLHGHLYLKSAL